MKIAITDIETSGFLPQGGKIVEIGIVELDLETGERKVLFDSLVKEDGFSESDRRGKLGWIFKNSNLTFEECNNAAPLESFREEIQAIYNKYRSTAFNKKFDFDFLESRGFKIEHLPCPMLLSTNACKLPGKRGGYKWPSVQEAWDFLFGKQTGYVEEHRGCDDADHEAEIVFELYLREVFIVPQINHRYALRNQNKIAKALGVFHLTTLTNSLDEFFKDELIVYSVSDGRKIIEVPNVDKPGSTFEFIVLGKTHDVFNLAFKK